ncbi:MAG: hypothetical protein HOD43_06300 [Candidatus Marinimicrobia bacterium]|jgi:hypothetical protein|nr:hypothetical protein [Candidatus Neomarinimicrobiota bacterium]MBT4295403.1 hypothetical protein [Candidatus Neomarinimicrobiota bacterium]MBT4994352.1 hypothetical protein [Candidatus Neomarinimicrobiota bacterium]MBT6217868.1 hypothetical protein [Candidatus Neomarinimicrobiota bacterium]
MKTNSKMIELELKVNGCGFHLLELEDIRKLKDSGFKKVGYFSRKLIKAKQNEKIYFSKNCTISLFKSLQNQSDAQTIDKKVFGEFIFGPSGKSRDYLSGPWGTSIYTYFVESKLQKVSFQTIGNRIMAKKAIMEFEKRVLAIYGEPNDVQEDETRICTWIGGNSKVISELNESISNSYIHWAIEE